MPDRCVAALVPQAAIDAAVLAASKPIHDDGHTDCYYAGILLAAWPHLAPVSPAVEEPHEGCHERACECVTKEVSRLRAETLRQGQRITEQDALLVASEEDAGRLRDAIGEHRAAVMHGARTVDDVTDADETLWALAGSPSGKETPEP